MMQCDARELMLWLRRLATMLHNGIPILQALTALSRISDEPLDEVSAELAEAIDEGAEVSQAMAEHREIFSHLSLIVCRAGEIGGVLDKALDHLAAWMESAQSARDAYDVAAASLRIHGRAVPDMEELVARQSSDFGGLVQAIAFCRIFGMCAEAGVPFGTTLGMAGQLYMDTTQRVETIEKACDTLTDSDHDEIAACLLKLGLPEIVCVLARGGAFAGRLSSAMNDAAELLERERDYTLSAAVNRIVQDN